MEIFPYWFTVFTKALQTVLAAAALALACASSAAPVTPTLSGSYDVVNGNAFDIKTIASNRDADGTPNGNPYTANYFYELIVGAFDSLTTFMLGGTTNETVPVRYFLWQDANPVAGAAQIAAVGTAGNGVAQGALKETVPYLTVGQNFQYSLPQGQYVLQIQKTASGWESITTNVSAVPLPGALWMFGAALMGFVGFSSRRKV